MVVKPLRDGETRACLQVEGKDSYCGQPFGVTARVRRTKQVPEAVAGWAQPEDGSVPRSRPGLTPVHALTQRSLASASSTLLKPSLSRSPASVIHDFHEKGMENGQTAPDGFLSKSVPPDFINMAGDGVPPKKLDSPSDQLACVGQDGAMRKPGSSARGGGAGSSSLSVDGPKAAAMSALGTMTNTVQISSQRANDDIKHELMKEVRRFGRKYERIFILLEEVQGPLEVKKQFVEFTIKEAARFKRRDLIQHLEKLLEKIDSDHLVEDENIQNV
nr:integrator complex subunit 6-like [Loxodonta africana]